MFVELANPGFTHFLKNEDIGYHVVKTDFTDDTNQNNVDISSFVPPNAKVAHLSWYLSDNATSTVRVYPTGWTNYTAASRVAVANIPMWWQHSIQLDNNLTFDVAINVKPSDWLNIQFMVTGWDS